MTYTRIPLPSGNTAIITLTESGHAAPVALETSTGRTTNLTETLRFWTNQSSALQVEDRPGFHTTIVCTPEDNQAINEFLEKRGIERKTNNPETERLANTPSPDNAIPLEPFHIWIERTVERRQLAQTAPGLLPIVICSQYLTDIVDQRKPLFESVAALVAVDKANIQRLASYPWTGTVLLDPIKAISTIHNAGMPVDWWPINATPEERRAFEATLVAAFFARCLGSNTFAKTLLHKSNTNWTEHHNRILQRLTENHNNQTQTPDALAQATIQFLSRNREASNALTDGLIIPKLTHHLCEDPHSVLSAIKKPSNLVNIQISLREEIKNKVAEQILAGPIKEVKDIVARCERLAQTVIYPSITAQADAEEAKNNSILMPKTRTAWLPFGRHQAETDDDLHDIWVPICEPVIRTNIKGEAYAIVPLWCKKHLEDEGRGYTNTQEHNIDGTEGLAICVGTSPIYKIECRKKRIAIVSIRQIDAPNTHNNTPRWKRIACMEVAIPNLAIKQIRGHNNKTPPHEVIQIAEDFIRDLKEKRIEKLKEFEDWIPKISKGSSDDQDEIDDPYFIRSMAEDKKLCASVFSGIAGSIIGYEPKDWKAFFSGIEAMAERALGTKTLRNIMSSIQSIRLDYVAAPYLENANFDIHVLHNIIRKMLAEDLQMSALPIQNTSQAPQAPAAIASHPIQASLAETGIARDNKKRKTTWW